MSGISWTKLQQLLAPSLDLGFSAYLSTDNTAAPGTLIRATTASKIAVVTDLIVYNAAAAAAVITFYDEDSTVMAQFKVGALETVVLTLTAGLRFDDVDAYVRTDQATNADVTIAGVED